MTLSKKLSSILMVSEHLLSNKIFHFIYIYQIFFINTYIDNKSVEFKIKLIANCNFFAKKNISHEISYQLDFVQLMCGVLAVNAYVQKYSRLRYLLLVKGLVICFYLGWSGSILPIRTNIIKVGSKSWLLTCSSNIILSLPSYAVSA